MKNEEKNVNLENPEHNYLTDQALIQSFLAGDQEAATLLYQRYADPLRAIAIRQSATVLGTRVDPDDIVQSVFRTFFRRLSSETYNAPDGDNLWRLFFVIALNKIRNIAIYHKALKRDVRQTVPLGEIPIASKRNETDEQLALSDLEKIISEILGELPESSQQIIRLRIEGHAVQDIATATGRAKRSVERVLQQFRNQLKAQFDENIQN